MVDTDDVSVIRTQLDRIEWLLGNLGSLFLVLMGVITLLQIAIRFFEINVAAVWTTSVARFLLVMMTFTGIPYAMRRGSHISVRPLLRRVSQSKRRYLILFANVLVLIMSVLMIQSGLSVLDRTMGQTLPTVGWIKIGYATIYMIIAFALNIVFLVETSRYEWAGETLKSDESEVEEPKTSEAMEESND